MSSENGQIPRNDPSKSSAPKDIRKKQVMTQGLGNFLSESEDDGNISQKIDRKRIKSLVSDGQKMIKFEYDKSLSSDQNYSDDEHQQSNTNKLYKKTDKQSSQKREEITIQKEVNKSKFEIREQKL